MSGLLLRPFEGGDLVAAGQLLAARHATHRRTQPLLDARYEDPATAQAQVEQAWASEGASGAVAERDGRAVGYLLGAPKPSPAWGPNVWVEAAGHAVEDPEVARDLYGLAASRWVDEGRTAQYVLLPAYDLALADAWWRVGFGQQHVHAIRQPADTVVPVRGVRVRRAVRADIPVLARLDALLPLQSRRSPVFSAVPLDVLEERLADWEESFEDPAFTTFVAEVDGAVVGSSIGCAIETSSMHTGLARPDGAGFLGFAAVLPEARGIGVGRALGDGVIGWASDAGYRSVASDWRATNLLAARAWPALGFRPTYLRLHRLVGY